MLRRAALYCLFIMSLLAVAMVLTPSRSERSERLCHTRAACGLLFVWRVAPFYIIFKHVKPKMDNLHKISIFRTFGMNCEDFMKMCDFGLTNRPKCAIMDEVQWGRELL